MNQLTNSILSYKLKSQILKLVQSPYVRPHRILAAELGMIARPDFMIIGTQKGGTTSLYQYLTAHSRIRPALRKEVHYFDIEYHRSLNWYLAHFPVHRQSDNTITGEASPYYLFHPQVPARVESSLGEVKIIVLLRNPIDRAFSQYQHQIRQGIETLSFACAIRRELELLDRHDWHPERLLPEDAFAHRYYSYISRGLYWRQLQRWINVIPPANLLVLRSEDFFEHRAQILAKAFSFLDLTYEGPTSFSVYNRGQYEGMSEDIRTRLRTIFQPHNAMLAEVLDIEVDDWV